jgi:hypothetical protein
MHCRAERQRRGPFHDAQIRSAPFRHQFEPFDSKAGAWVDVRKTYSRGGARVSDSGCEGRADCAGGATDTYRICESTHTKELAARRPSSSVSIAHADVLSLVSCKCHCAADGFQLPAYAADQASVEGTDIPAPIHKNQGCQCSKPFLQLMKEWKGVLRVEDDDRARSTPWQISNKVN